MINIKDISFSYGDKKVLSNFSLEINRGERICLYGESGCGKSTLLKLIAGLEKEQSGKIERPKNLKISFVFQENLLLPFKTALKNVTLVCKDTEVATENLKALGVEDAADMLPSSLSGGMERRVAIARALSADFDLLILDEPFTGLDAENINIAAKRILEVAKDRPIILVTHNLAEAELFGARVIKM